jgi:large subunit ribosomal protein L10
MPAQVIVADLVRGRPSSGGRFAFPTSRQANRLDDSPGKRCEVAMARPETRNEPRAEKVDAVRDIADRFNDSDAALLTQYRGLRVQEIAEVRNALREAGAEYKVLKNTLARIAVREVGLEDLAGLLEGPTAIAFVTGDAAAAAKALDEAAKKYPVLEIKGGVLLGKIIDAAQAQKLARLESREILLSKVAMLANSPAQQTANVFSALLRNFGSMLAQVVTKKSELAPGADEGGSGPTALGGAVTGELPGGTGAEAAAAEVPAAEIPAPDEIGEPAEEAATDEVEESTEETPRPSGDAPGAEAEGDAPTTLGGAVDVGQPEPETPAAEAAPAELPEAQEQAEAAPESPEAKSEEVETTTTEEEQ